MSKAEEYEICQRRGHQPTGVGTSDTFRTWWRCKWCGTKYATESVAQTIEEPGSQPVEEAE